MKLSIAITTYNHEEYIKKAIDSVYTQELDCEFEIIIADDNSSDNTVDEIKQLQKKHTEIKLIENITNIGYTKNFDKVLKECKGEYIAIFDGDDIMLPDKLNKQISFLDTYSDYVMVAHKTRAFDSNTGKTIRYIEPPIKKEFYTVDDIIQYGSIFANSSKMFRKSALPEKGIDHNIKKIADWYLTILIAHSGKTKYLTECLLNYRVHNNSIMKKIAGDIHYKDVMYILERLSEMYNGKYDKLFYRQKAYAYLINGIYFFEQKDLQQARNNFTKSILNSPFYSISAYLRLFLTFLPFRMSTQILRKLGR